ncbi:tudor domain-containing protein 5-like [Pseudomyrmex gracilis]|uniref:tudor domain-containing protein 5-like n=1 Tax=Pseudomyrmex gracilis TaxID=219809 RepID=UPI0009949488|nr:tudor domain-containing protein 5-like [Pseudomyrmex gracilis]
MWPQQVQEGGVYSIDIGDKTWQRGIRTKDLGENGVFVFLRDWGTVVHRQKNHIYVLEDKFRELPWQAIPCGLAFTAPDNFAPYWSKRANVMMRLTCEGKGGLMRVRGIAGNRHKEAYVDLKIQMENGGDAVYIRSLLKSLGYTRDVPKVKTETQPFIAGMSQ